MVVMSIDMVITAYDESRCRLIWFMCVLGSGGCLWRDRVECTWADPGFQKQVVLFSHIIYTVVLSPAQT